MRIKDVRIPDLYKILSKVRVNAAIETFYQAEVNSLIEVAYNFTYKIKI